MGWCLKTYLSGCVKKDWISQEQADHIHEHMNVPTHILLLKLIEANKELHSSCDEYEDRLKYLKTSP